MTDYRREEAMNETRSRQTNEWIEVARHLPAILSIEVGEWQ